MAGVTVTADEYASFDRTVAKLRALPADDPVRLRAEQVAASFARDGRLRRRKDRRRQLTETDAAVTAATATGATARREDAPLHAEVTLPHASEAGEEAPRVYVRARHCYVCKERYRQADAFYHRLCPTCAADNSARRHLRTDLRGRRALLTGGRVKIGFQLALMMLRDGAEVLVTTRFPRDTLRRFRAAPGSEEWFDRLTVIAIDLRDPRQVLGLCEHLRDEGRPLDILVNNAAQTVRRPPSSFALLAAGERAVGPADDAAAPPGAVLCAPGFRPWPVTLADGGGRRLHAGGALFQAGGALSLVLADTAAELDEAGLLPDTAPANSWSTRLGEVDPVELLETQLVNALAPALLCDRLLPLLLASPYPRRYVVNVTAVEGRFAVRNKTAGHPHTNMAKAALNMLTRTSGPELGEQGVHMCSVDTGWITDENPAPKKARLAEDGFRTPLDVVDGAARIYDPIVRGEAGAPVSGVFLKDYQEAAW